jgi:DNA-binding transcriptional ArsR family regulator
MIGWLFFKDGLTVDEMSSLLELPETTVRRKLGRAMSSISDMLGGIIKPTTKPRTVKTKAYVLDFLKEGPAKAADLAERTGLHRKVVGKQLERLYAAGQVQRNDQGLYSV